MATGCTGWLSTVRGNHFSCIGPEKVATRVGNVFYVVDSKEGTAEYLSPDYGTDIPMICMATGHQRLPIIAFVESVVRPRVHLFTTVDQQIYASFDSPNITLYLDLKFSEHDILVGLGCQPHYTLRFWNIRTEQLVAEFDTMVKVNFESLIVTNQSMPTVYLFSVWDNEMYSYDMCHHHKEIEVYETSHYSFSKEYQSLTVRSFATIDDGKLYVVNDRGAVAHLETKQLRLSEIWKSPYSLENEERAEHELFSGRHSLIVYAKSRLICIKKKQNYWHIEWLIENIQFHIANLITNLEFDSFVASDLGDLYKVTSREGASELIRLNKKDNYLFKDVIIPKGIKEEALLAMIDDGLVLFEISDMTLLAKQEISSDKKIQTFNTFNTMPFVVVGTATGEVLFYTYEKISSFELIAELSMGFPITAIYTTDTMIIAEDNHCNFRLIDTDVRNCKFSYVFSIEDEITGPVFKTNCFLLDAEHFAVFVGREKMNEIPYSNELWMYEFKANKSTYRKTIYNFPEKYKSFVMGGFYQRLGYEFFGVRLFTSIVDIFYYTSNGTIKLDASLQIPHVSACIEVSYNKNLLSWSPCGTIISFRSHKKSAKPYRVSKRTHLKFRPASVIKNFECFNLKYYVTFMDSGQTKCRRLANVMDNVDDNIELPLAYTFLQPKKTETKHFKANDENVEIEMDYTEEELKMPDIIRAGLAKLAKEVSELIDYDMSVTQRTSGIFSKFCLNTAWLSMLTEQARLLCKIERELLEIYISDQERIRDWIKSLIFKKSDMIAYNIRALYSNIKFENYALRRSADNFVKEFDLCRFYDLEADSDEDDEGFDEDKDEHPDGEAKGEKSLVKKRYVVQPPETVYNHVMSPEFSMQPIDITTVNQFNYNAIMFKVKLSRALKEEFNKLFFEVQKFKQEAIGTVSANNAALIRIYDNMNIMLGLLGMEQFDPPDLMVPEWMNDEILERILEVDESEVKAINRRKKKAIEVEKKKGRMLLWSIEFWERALIQMMDGVLEKLWEEEIKKDIPLPEFMLKKQPHEYSIEDQRLLKEYEEKVKNLENDRRKYLKILKEMEGKALKQKALNILKINEKVAEMAILKLKYDFAVRHGILRILNNAKSHLLRVVAGMDMKDLVSFGSQLYDFATKCSSLISIWENSVQEMRQKVEAAVARDKQVEKQLRANFLANLPPVAANELLKVYKRRPKINPKLFNNFVIASEVAQRIISKTAKSSFPLPRELHDFVISLDVMDSGANCPSQVDIKQWEQFCKLRRMKTETEIRIRAAYMQLNETTMITNASVNDLDVIRNQKSDTLDKLNNTILTFLSNVQNMDLQITLNNGQIEVDFGGRTVNLANAILMNVEDINEVNELIKAAGRKKLRAMHRVAAFRRQVIYREWEHKMFCANITYLKYMLNVIEKCKVSKEFLDILRKWDKIKDQREYMLKVGIIERTVEQKVAAYRVNLDRLLDKIAQIKEKIEDMRNKNRRLSRKIELVKVDVTVASLKRDELLEERHATDLKERMTKIRNHHQLLTNVRRDYARILELNTILELQRLRTFPTLAPAPPDCPPLKDFC